MGIVRFWFWFGTHRLDTEPLAALPPLSLPFRAAEEVAAAAGSMFWEAMSGTGLFPVENRHGSDLDLE